MSVNITLAEVAAHLQAEIQGDADIALSAVATLLTAVSGELSFIASQKYLTDLKNTSASAVIIAPALRHYWAGNALIVNDPYLAYAKAAALFKEPTKITTGIHPSAIMGHRCQLDSDVSIGANVVLGDEVKLAAGVIVAANSVIGDQCNIGANSEIKSNVTLVKKVRLGEHCIIHSGAVLGCDGFGNANDNGYWHKIPQLGGVVIGDDVEIGANTTVDCGALGDTTIEKGVRIDNLVQIAHNVFIGAHTAIAACCGIAGSTKIGKYCMLGGQVGIAGHLTICDKVMLTGRTMVTHSISEPGVYSSGTGMLENSRWRKTMVHLRNLDKLVSKIRRLEKSARFNDG